MSFLKQILKPFVEFDEEVEKKVEEKPKVSPQPSPPILSKNAFDNLNITHEASHPLIDEIKKEDPIATLAPTYTPTGSLDKPLPEHILYFEKLIDQANATNPSFQGADYKEFIDNKLDIDDIADEALKYKTAYNVLKSSGLTKAKLLQTAQEYLELIGRDLNNFQGAQSLKYRKEIGPKEEQIQKKAEELQALQQKINKLKSEINSLGQEVTLAKEKMNTVRTSFLLAGELKQNEIAGEVKKIDQYF